MFWYIVIPIILALLVSPFLIWAYQDIKDIKNDSIAVLRKRSSERERLDAWGNVQKYKLPRIDTVTIEKELIETIDKKMLWNIYAIIFRKDIKSGYPEHLKKHIIIRKIY